ncbi:hypothetical protein Tco_1017973 [Tanacetum coccineum]|uniref:Uncharacterized protein n=1 Tax=Tanacetum coccineum TaxID=301880 RepID=A0ABQ5FT02_9ASTR
MENPDITMEEYIKLEAEKARRHGQEFNWKTATYGKVRLSIRRIQTPWIRRIDYLDVIQSLFFCNLNFIVRLVDTAYSLNEYSVFDF